MLLDNHALLEDDALTSVANRIHNMSHLMEGDGQFPSGSESCRTRVPERPARAAPGVPVVPVQTSDLGMQTLQVPKDGPMV